MSSDSTRLAVFDWDTQKWRDIGQGSLGFNSWTADSQSVVVLDSNETGSIRKFRISYGKAETIADLKAWFPPGSSSTSSLSRPTTRHSLC